MYRITSAAVLILALSAAAWTPAKAQTPPWQGMGNPNVVVDYIEPRKPVDPKDKSYADDSAAYDRMMKIYDRYKKRQVLEEFSAFLSPLRLPHTLRVRLVQCNTVNAFYNDLEWSINICYEWIDETEGDAPKDVSPEGITRQEAIVGGFVGVLLHEAGHAVNDIFNIPVLGREEDAADQMAGFLMLQFGKGVARTAMMGTAYTWLTFSRTDRAVYWDVHSTPAQRFYNFLCIAYGAEPEVFKDLVDRFMNKDRVANCKHEYEQVRNAFVKTMLPHIDQDKMKKVQAMQWLRPDDGLGK